MKRKRMMTILERAEKDSYDYEPCGFSDRDREHALRAMRGAYMRAWAAATRRANAKRKGKA